MKHLLLVVALLLPAYCYADEPLVIDIYKSFPTYTESNTSIGHASSSVMDEPRSVSVLSSKIIDEQSPKTFGDILQNFSGVSMSADESGQRSNPMIRGFGFDDDNSAKINGQYSLWWNDPDIYNIESVEIIKGPAGSLYGKGNQIGGTFNIITKQPQFTKSEEIYSGYGSYGSYYDGFDITGPINNNVAFRINGSYTDKNSFLSNNANKERITFNPSFTILGDDSTLTIDGRYVKDNQNFSYGAMIPAVGTKPADIPLQTNLSSPRDHYNISDGSIGYKFNTHIDDFWEFNNNARYQEVVRLKQYLNGSSLNEQTGSYDMSYFHENNTKTLVSTDTNVVNKTKNNTFIFGFDTLYTRHITNTYNISGTYNNNIYNPTTFQSNYQYPGSGSDDKTLVITQTYGTYVQDEYHINEQFIINTGLRYDYNNPTASLNHVKKFDKDETGLGGNIGLTYKPLIYVSLFTNYVNQVSPLIQETSTYYEPQRAEQYEAGMKSELFSKTWINSLSLFQVTKSNVAAPDPNNSALNIYTGEIRNRGIETDNTFKITDDFNILANYSYILSVISKDDTGNKGNTPYNVPKHSGSLWGMYEPKNDYLKGFGFGGGARFQTTKQGDNSDDYSLPAYTVFDAVMFYHLNDNIKFQLDVKNIFDTKYYVATDNSRYSILQGEPLNIMGSVSVKF